MGIILPLSLWIALQRYLPCQRNQERERHGAWCKLQSGQRFQVNLRNVLLHNHGACFLHIL